MKTKRLTISAMMLALIIVLGFFPSVPLAFIPAPLIIQNLAIILTGLLLNKKESFTVVTVFLLMVAIGLPLLAGGKGNAASFIGPTAGYLFAYPLCAFLISYSIEKLPQPITLLKTFVISFIFGVLLLDFLGALGLHLSPASKMPLLKAIYLQITFIPGDTIKALLASLVYVFLPKKLTGRQ
ncbi:biotin transporter BioY [Streptococcaceae bacterium ESL0729]|nr:biotin transporter BioY [Streptococcaceae bacterium ESL0729]